MQDSINWDDQKLKTILEKTVELFCEFGIRNLNMDDISRKLKISKKTLYHYVKNKEDLIDKLFQYDGQKWSKEFAKINIKELNAIELLLKVSLMIYEEMGKINPKFMMELRQYYQPIFDQIMLAKQNHIFERISKNIQKGIKEGLYRSDVNIELAATLYVRNMVDMHSKDYCFAENISFKQVFEAMFENHIRAISTQEGIDYFEKRKSEIHQFNNNN